MDWMRSVDMAVVVSQSQNEIDDLKDILPHRERMQKEDLESKFKDPDDPLRLVFVCARGIGSESRRGPNLTWCQSRGLRMLWSAAP
jgi:hypothetical protein